MKRFLPLLCLGAMAATFSSCTYTHNDGYAYSVPGPRGTTSYGISREYYSISQSPTTSRHYAESRTGKYIEWGSIGHGHPYDINKYQAYSLNSGMVPR